MPRIKTEDLVSEIAENAREDRTRLKNFADGLRKFAERGQPTDEGDEGEMDPDVALALSEQMSKVSDSLTKINQQLIELVKIDAKSRPAEEQGGEMSVREKDRVYDDIEKARECDA